MSLITDPFTSITLVSIAYGIFSFTVTQVLGNRKRLKQIRKEMNAYTKELRKAMKENDEQKLEELKQKQKEFSKLTIESFKYQMIPLIILLPIVGVVLRMLANKYNDFVFNLPFGVPFIHPSTEYGYLALFMIVIFITSLILSGFLKIFETYNKGK